METDSEIPLSLLCLAFLSVYALTVLLQYSSRLAPSSAVTNTNTSFSNFNQLVSFIKYIPIIGLSVCLSFLAITVVDPVWLALGCGFIILLMAILFIDFVVYKITSANVLGLSRCSNNLVSFITRSRKYHVSNTNLNNLSLGNNQTSSLVDSLERSDSILTKDEVVNLDEKDREMLRSIVRLDVSTAREIMVPRLDMVAVEITAGMDEVVELFLKSGHSRLPVYEDTIDHVTGVVHARDILGVLADQDRKFLLLDFIRPPFFIPESKRLDGLLQEMQEKSIQFAIVVDEYGGTEGLVSMEDLLEEIVGELEDEFSSNDKPVTQFSDGSAIIDAGVTTEDVEDLFKTNLNDSDVDTIGGYVYRTLGRIPQVGDVVAANELNIEVISVLGRRLRKLRVKPILG
ncbi:MAG: hemolysin family protein [Chloroflexota bacterium]|nr:hemolysin family protein [Chloroflexota bacterium]